MQHNRLAFPSEAVFLCLNFSTPYPVRPPEHADLVSFPPARTDAMKDIKPLLLLLLSLALVGTWAYHVYDKTQYVQAAHANSKDHVPVNPDHLKDSLSKVYEATINNLDSRLSVSGDSLATTREVADSLKRNLAARISEINRLKSEIGNILNKSELSPDEMATAKQKVGELQDRVQELSQQNASMEAEKQKLSVALAELSQNSDKLEQNMRKLNEENTSLNEKIAMASYFIASDVKLSAMEVKSTAEQPTTQAKKADKFVISFAVQNNVYQYSNAEIIIVIVQPDKQILQSSNWDSGLFETKNDGKKGFSRVVKFDYTKGERKELTFSLEAEDIQRGGYALQLWHKGIKIGQSQLVLN
jgi:myosin heavy subunit